MSEDREIGRLSSPGLLIVDDEPAIGAALRRTLRSEPYAIFTCESPIEALEVLQRENIGVVISDYKMPGMNGAEFLTRVRAEFPDVQRIMLTGQADASAVEEMINQSQIFRFITKPWDPQALILTIAASFDQYRVARENVRLLQLTEEKNRQLIELNKTLEDRIARRTLQLQRAKLEWERSFDAIQDPVAIINTKYQVVRANRAYAKALALDVKDVPGRSCHRELVGRDTPCPACPASGTFRNEPPRGTDIRAKDRILNVWAYAMPEPDAGESSGVTDFTTLMAGMTAVCHYRDVTEERALQAELSRSQKLASLGLFVGGVAHEINNPIGSVLAFSQLLLRNRPSGEELWTSVKDIERSALRCKRIIESLLSFAQGSEHLRKAEVDLAPVVEESVRSFLGDYTVDAGVVIECHSEPDLPRVEADPALIHQLVRSLLQNAEESMQGRSGTVRVELRLSGSDVRLEVKDEGRGIPERHIPRIFDPFYTTKQDGEGTGLGLSICHRIVAQHGGNIEAQSQVGQGTSVRVTLPAARRSSGGP